MRVKSLTLRMADRIAGEAFNAEPGRPDTSRLLGEWDAMLSRMARSLARLGPVGNANPQAWFDVNPSYIPCEVFSRYIDVVLLSEEAFRSAWPTAVYQCITKGPAAFRVGVRPEVFRQEPFFAAFLEPSLAQVWCSRSHPAYDHWLRAQLADL
jgi:hypothetical protein